jgi:CHAT domain-containing protein/Tfp pilus assembly protein PilF
VKLGVTLLLTFFLLQPAIHSQELQALEVGKPIERELGGGQAHSYQIMLAAGQFLDAVVEQRDIDVVVKLFGPDGRKLIEVDSPNGTQGPEPMQWVAAEVGAYRLEVRSLEKEAKAGRYEVKVVALRVATAEDRLIVEALGLYAEAVSLQVQRKFDEAIARAERALTSREQALGPDHTGVAEVVGLLAALYQAKGDLPKAIQMYERSIAIRGKALGPEHLDVTISLDNLAVLYYNKGDYARAEPLFQRSLMISEKALGPDHPDVATSLNNLAEVYNAEGDYARAEPLHQRALAIREKVLGPEHPDVAASLNNLAELYRVQSDYARAEPLYQRSLTIWEKALGPDHLNVAFSLNNLAGLYRAKGDYRSAEPLYRRSLAIREKSLGLEHPNVAIASSNLAFLYHDKGDYSQAEPIFQRSLMIIEKALGPDHPSVAISLNNLALLYHNKGDYARAKPLFHRSLAIREKALGPEHSAIAQSLYNLAVLSEATSDHAQAEPLFQRALAIWEKAFAPNHPNVARSLNNLAGLYHADGKTAQALTFLRRAAEVTESNLARNLAAGSERQMLSYLALSAGEINHILSLHARVAPADPEALRLALTTLLRRKGRGLDAVTDIITALRRRADPQDQALFDQLASARTQLAAITLRGPTGNQFAAYRARLQQLEEESEKLEANLSARSAEFRAATQPITLEAIQAVIPESAALVEFAVYRPYDAKTRKSDPARYSAYVLAHEGEPRWVELGEAAVIDRNVTALRQALRDPQRSDVRRLARTLDEQVMRPVRMLLGPARRVLISPDGALNLVPFAALVDERNQYLVERYSIGYLTSGRDLLRLQVPRQNKSEPLIVADPTFGAVAGTETQLAANIRRSPTRRQTRGPLKNFSEAYFEPLPETGREARDIKELLPQATVLTKEQANETALKKLSAPSILHIATHGFFLQDEEASVEKTRGLSLFGGASNLRGSNWAAKIENPLLRSGLALAGFNQHKSGDDDGALTALEAAGLDLWGTKLVVLSACDTDVGEVKNGEGVYGLRRALVLAGSESQVMSLWKVSDYVTRLWMTDYYTGLKQGQGRSEALRQVQLKMLKSKERRHPFYWASFIQSGEWANLDGQR